MLALFYDGFFFYFTYHQYDHYHLDFRYNKGHGTVRVAKSGPGEKGRQHKRFFITTNGRRKEPN